MSQSPFEQVMYELDVLHEQDPRSVDVDGESMARELWHARQMSAWLDQLLNLPDELLQLAVRGQHLQRWQVSRQEYPEGRQGYLQWRTDQGRRAGETTAQLMRGAGYSQEDSNRVAQMIRKEGLNHGDDAVQTLEDCACLVFLENYFADFSQKVERDHMVRIVRKTWRKMSGTARELALAIPMAPEAREIVEEALAA